MKTKASVIKKLIQGIQPSSVDFEPSDGIPTMIVTKKYNGTFDIGAGLNDFLKEIPEDDAMVEFAIFNEPKPQKVKQTQTWGPGYWAMIRGSRRRKDADLSKAGKK
jgi:hypothetical protein